MDFATTDLVLASVHHLLIFALAGILAYEIAVLRPAMTGADIHRVGKVDLWYGVLAGAILVAGFARAHMAAKGWDYYAANLYFWAKIGAFALVGILSIPPTVMLIRWRIALKRTPAFVPEPGAVVLVRKFLWAEVVVFAFIPVFAAMMARGYG